MRLRHVLAAGWLCLVAAAGLMASRLGLPEPLAVDPIQSLAQPSRAHALGTDLLGRDVLSRMVWGARRTLGMALLAVAVSALPGTVVGLVAGYAGDPLDGWLMRATEAVLALPQLLIALVVVSALGPAASSVGLAVGLAGIAGFARLTRAAVLPIREQHYILAARALGASHLHIALRHVLPNAAAALAAITTIYFAWGILHTSTLTFLGFGGSPATPDWGILLNDGRAYLIAAPWLSTAPGLAITLTVLAANVIGSLWGEARRGMA